MYLTLPEALNRQGAVLPDPYPNARYRFTELARDMAIRRGVDLNEVIEVVRNYNHSEQGWSAGEWWYTGETRQGQQLSVLVQEIHDGEVRIITIRP